MWKTPGIWNDIPEGAHVRAEARGTIVDGHLIRLVNPHGGTMHANPKKLLVEAYGLGRIELDVRDGWEVTYEVKGFDEIVAAAPVGTVWRVVDEAFPRFVKVSEQHVTKQAFRDGSNSTPEVFPILQFGAPADGFVEIRRNVLAEAAER